MSTERLWNQRRGHVAYCLLVFATAWSATLAAAITVPPTVTDLATFAALGAMGIVEAELARQIERVRRRPDRAVHINLTSVWSFAAVLLLSPALTALLVAGLHGHLYARGWYRQKQVPMYRTMMAGFLLILTCFAVRIALAAVGIDGIRDAIDAGWPGAAALAAGIGMFLAVNAILVMLALYTGGRGIRDLFTGWPDGLLLELATLVLGALLAVIAVTLPGLAVLIILPVFVLHRAVLVEQFESAARQDTKTGVLNMAGWHLRAGRELARNGTTFGVLMIDLDHFKQINDRYGHLAGDTVLKAVADTINAIVRRTDLVGRFGGEEFVVLLTGMAPRDVSEVAERIRTAITRLEIPLPDREWLIDSVSASIGIATSPAAGTGIEQLLLSADAAMYRAKAAGRNRVEGPDPG